MTKLKVLCTIVLLALAPVASGQVVYDEVKIKVAPGVTCPSGWTASTERITIEARYIVTVPASIGGRSFRVTSSFVNLIWPSAADKATATTTGVLVIEAGSVSTVHFCSLLP